MKLSSNFNNLSINHFSANEKVNFDHTFSEKETIEIKTPFNLNFFRKSSKEEKDGLFSINFSDTNSLFSSILDPNPMPSHIEFIQKNSDYSETRNDSISSNVKAKLFANTESYSNLAKEGEGMLKRKRFQERRARKENRDNIRKKIKRGFFNCALIKKLNEVLKSIGSKKYFMKFPQHFVSDINQVRNKEIFGMTLREIFCKIELYLPGNKEGLINYLNNLKVIKSQEVEQNEIFNKILDKTIREIYEEYLNSEEFKVEEINRLKEKKMRDEYIESYISLARYLVKYYSE